MFVQDWHHCMDFEDCKNCWNNCDQQLGPFPLNINSALRQGSLVLTDIAWDQAITNASKQCLVTWEVSGGGLMGNLLTDSSTVELSLWPDTVYHVQVTCKHKETGGMRRSYKLIVDTHKLSDATATGMQAIAMDNVLSSKTMPNIYAGSDGQSGASSGETDSRMRILKDSSKDFLTPYNPNAATTTTKSSTSTTSTTRKSAASSTASSSYSYSSSSSSAATTSSIDREADERFNSVLRTKLTGNSSSVPLSDYDKLLMQCVVFGTFVALVLFIGLVVLYIIKRYIIKDMSAASLSGIDKQLLIHREMLPSKTDAAAEGAKRQKKSTAATNSNSRHPVAIVQVLTATATPDARTLHV